MERGNKGLNFITSDIIASVISPSPIYLPTANHLQLPRVSVVICPGSLV
jgi:hypothetical protein